MLPHETDTVEENREMNSKSIGMSTGGMTVMEFDGVSLHYYSTADAINDQAILVANDATKECVVIETPCFRDSIAAMTSYIEENGLRPVAKLISYHAAGTSFLPGVPAYMTDSAAAYNTDGEGAQTIGMFAGAFGDAFDSSIVARDRVLGEGKNVIAGIVFVINGNDQAYEVEIPAAKAVYVHMIGHDVHSIIPSVEAAGAMADSLQGYIDRGFTLFLSSHYGPETVDDVRQKIAYLRDVGEIAGASADADDFKARVNAKYPGYGGANYLDMTAGALFR